jgi:hypothetical protein
MEEAATSKPTELTTSGWNIIAKQHPSTLVPFEL